MMPKVAVVTGANQGLGYALVRRLCRTLGSAAVVYLTARNVAKGEAAVRALQREGLSPKLHHLDVTEAESVALLAEMVRERHGGVDILISNAAARIDPNTPQAAQVRPFVETNNHGTFRVIQAFRSLLKDGARFVIVASSFGSLHHLASHLHPRFDAATRTLADIEAVLDDYAAMVEAGTAADAGWPDWINIPSKVGQVAAMRSLAREMRDEANRRGLLINAVCPGLVDTAASRPWFDDMSAAQAPDEAAVDVVWLATLPRELREPYGELVQHRSVIR